MEGILSQDDILSHVFASSCWFDPCWCFPYREPPPNQRPTPAIHLRLLFRLRLICHISGAPSLTRWWRSRTPRSITAAAGVSLDGWNTAYQ